MPNGVAGSLGRLLTAEPSTSQLLDPDEDLTAALTARQTIRRRILDAAAVLASAAVTDIAALRVLDWQLPVLERRAAGEQAEPVRARFFNPLHALASRTAQFTGRGGGTHRAGMHSVRTADRPR